MAHSIRRIPTWAIVNTAFLFAPIFLTVLAFGSYRFWFVPQSEFIAPAVLILIAYYVVVLRFASRSSGHSFRSLWPTFRRSHPKVRDAVLALGGFGAFCIAAFYSFYAIIPAAFTATTGKIVDERASIASVDSINPSRRCGTEVKFREVSPAMSSGFCIGNRGELQPLLVGDRVTLHGRRSVFGLWVIRIDR